MHIFWLITTAVLCCRNPNVGFTTQQPAWQANVRYARWPVYEYNKQEYLILGKCNRFIVRNFKNLFVYKVYLIYRMIADFLKYFFGN